MKQTALSFWLLCSLVGPAAAESVDISHPIEAGGAVRVDVSYGRIRIVGSEPGTVRVRGEISEELTGISLEREGGAVEVRVRFPFFARLWSLGREPSAYRTDLVVELPIDTPLFVVSKDADIEIDGVRGPIGTGVVSSAVVVRGKPALLDFEAVSGSLDFQGQTSKLQASTLSGDVRAAGPEGIIELEAVTGTLAVLDARIDRATLTTVSGDVSVHGQIQTGGVLEIQTESGEVSLECTKPDGIVFDLETHDGEILNEISPARPIRDARGRRVLKLNGAEGDALVHVRTRSGLIWVSPAGPSAPEGGGVTPE